MERSAVNPDAARKPVAPPSVAPSSAPAAAAPSPATAAPPSAAPSPAPSVAAPSATAPAAPAPAAPAPAAPAAAAPVAQSAPRDVREAWEMALRRKKLVRWVVGWLPHRMTILIRSLLRVEHSVTGKVKYHWRRSLQLRVVGTTLVISATMIAVL